MRSLRPLLLCLAFLAFNCARTAAVVSSTGSTASSGSMSYGTSPFCSSGCPGCQVQPVVGVGNTVTVTSLVCPTYQAVVFRTLSFAPMCSGSSCSNIQLSATFRSGTNVVVATSNSSNCFAQPFPVVPLDGSKNAYQSVQITAHCLDSAPCFYASLIDVFCQAYLPGNQISATTSSTGRGLVLKDGDGQCACVGCSTTASLSAKGSFFYLPTGACTAPYLNKVFVQATDSTSSFRVYTKTTGNANPSTLFYPLGSSTVLTGEPVSCFNSQFTPGLTTSLVSVTSDRNLVVVVECASASCNFQYSIDVGCSTASVQSTPSFVLDGCMNRCGNFGNCVSGSCGSCKSGFTGDFCTIPPASLPISVQSSGTAGSTGASSSGYNPTIWLGTYSSSGCDATQCCCATVITIADSGSSYTVTGSSLQGSCGGQTSVSASFSVPTSNTVSYSIGGQSHTATVTSAGRIQDVNNMYPVCNGNLVNNLVISGASGNFGSGSSSSSSSSSSKKGAIAGGVVGGVLGALLLVGIGIWFVKFRNPVSAPAAPAAPEKASTLTASSPTTDAPVATSDPGTKVELPQNVNTQAEGQSGPVTTNSPPAETTVELGTVVVHVDRELNSVATGTETA